MSGYSDSKICIPLCRSGASELVRDTSSAFDIAEIVELRLDCLNASELAGFISRLPVLASSGNQSLIVTLRAHDQGGHNQLSREERASFWKSIADACPGVDDISGAKYFFDIELDILTDPELRPIWDNLGWNRIISSHHDFIGPGENLRAVYDSLVETGAGRKDCSRNS